MDFYMSVKGQIVIPAEWVVHAQHCRDAWANVTAQDGCRPSCGSARSNRIA